MIKRRLFAFIAGGLLACIEGRVAVAQTPDWQSGPVVHVRPFEPPAIDSMSVHGVPLYLVSMPGSRLVAVDIVSRSGSSADPPGRRGLAVVTAGVMGSLPVGNGRISASEAAALAGADLSVRATRQSIRILIRAPAFAIDSALALVSPLLSGPLPSDSVVRNLAASRAAQATRVLQFGGNAAALALGQAAYGTHAVEAAPTVGMPSDLRGLGVADVAEFRRWAFSRPRFGVVITGHLGRAAAIALVNRWIGGAADRSSMQPPIATSDSSDSLGHNVVVDVPAFTQLAVRVVTRLPRRTDPLAPALETLAYIIGGSTDARLGRAISGRGFSYSARAAIEWRRTGGLFIASTDVAPVSGEMALRALSTTVSEAATTVTDDELRAAKNALTQLASQGFQTADAVAETVGDLFDQALPRDFWRTYASRLRAVDRTTLDRAAPSLRADVLHRLVVGRRDAALQAFASAGVPSPRVVSSQVLLQP
jgi:zinc protease